MKSGVKWKHNNVTTCMKIIKLKTNSNSYKIIIVLACNRGLYGADCSETCGQCRDVNQCFNVNGRCLTGCEDGYVGHLCKTREWSYMKNDA